MKEGLTEVIMILDRSGSMQMDQKDKAARDGVNRLLAEQRTIEGELRITIVKFCNSYEYIWKSEPLENIAELTAGQYSANGGSTALLDAVGRVITEMKEEFEARPSSEQPQFISVVTITDGEENASQTWKKDSLSELLQSQEAQGWDIRYLGAGFEAFAEAGTLGINGNHYMGIQNTGDGIMRGVAMYAANVTNFRATGQTLNWTGAMEDDENTKLPTAGAN